MAYLVEREEAGRALRVLDHRGELDMQVGREPVGRLQRREYPLVGRRAEGSALQLILQEALLRDELLVRVRVGVRVRVRLGLGLGLGLGCG